MYRLWLGFGTVLLVACGSSEGARGPTYVTIDSDASVEVQECIDNDGDGFGTFCGFRDCDDDDPDVTDLCFRCAADETDVDCPCEPGTEPVFCMPPSYEGEEGGVRGTYVCSEGTRYCRDAAWSECVVIGNYVFVPAE